METKLERVDEYVIAARVQLSKIGQLAALVGEEPQQGSEVELKELLQHHQESLLAEAERACEQVRRLCEA